MSARACQGQAGAGFHRMSRIIRYVEEDVEVGDEEHEDGGGDSCSRVSQSTVVLYRGELSMGHRSIDY